RGEGHGLAQRRPAQGRGVPEPRARGGRVNAAAVGVPRDARGLIAAFDRLLGRVVSIRSLALLRVLVGPIVLLHLQPFLSDALDGRIYSDAFYEPYASWYPELPEAVYVGLLCVGAVAAIAMSLGLLTRVATATTFAVVAYNLFLSTTHFHNNRAYLVIVLGLLAVAPCGRELSMDAWPRRRGRCGCCASSARRSTARPGSASCSTRTGSAARSPGSGSRAHAAIFRPGTSPTGRSRRSPTAASTPAPPSSSCS